MTIPNILIFDIETDGLLDELTKIHSLVIFNPETGESFSCADAYAEAGRTSPPPDGHSRLSIGEGLEFLQSANCICGHNIVSFDLPAIWKVYPEWGSKFRVDSQDGFTRDTILLSRLLYTNIREKDVARKGYPRNLIGAHSLEAWGHRLGEHKGSYEGGWSAWSEEMQRYCEQDVVVTAKLWERMSAAVREWGIDPLDPHPAASVSAVQLEHDVARIVGRQERFGFPFDVRAAEVLASRLLARQDELSTLLQQTFQPEIVSETFTPKVNNRSKGWEKGVPVVRTRTVPFNPASRQQVGARLKSLGWTPSEFTADGHAKVDDETLHAAAEALPAANVLADYFLNGKRIGMLVNGTQAWLKAEKRGRIHGRVVTNGAVTGRMTHSSPNLAQVPGVKAKKLNQRKDPFQAEYRALFRAPPGMKMVGCDADALELRDLAGYMAIYDGGEYIKTVLEGNKESGTDMHTLNAAALGCSRDTAKVWFYAFIYGAGDFKLGTILGAAGGFQEVARAGKKSRAKFLKALPALGKLTEQVAKRARERKYLVGLDGRRLFVRSEHAALNTLLQGAGACQMKVALVRLDAVLRVRDYVPGKDYEFLANVHDEWQIAARPEIAEEVGQAAAKAIEEAGEILRFRCPLKGNYVIGDTWADTH